MSRLENLKFRLTNAWYDLAANEEYNRIMEYTLLRMHMGKEAVRNDPLRKLKLQAIKYRRLAAGNVGIAIGATIQGILPREYLIASLPMLVGLSLVAFGVNFICDRWMQSDINRKY